MPVNQIRRMGDGDTGEEGEGGIYHVVIISYADNRGIREKTGTDRIVVHPGQRSAYDAFKVGHKRLMSLAGCDLIGRIQVNISFCGRHANAFHQILAKRNIAGKGGMMQDTALLVIAHIHADTGVFQQITDDSQLAGPSGQEDVGKAICTASLNEAGILRSHTLKLRQIAVQDGFFDEVHNQEHPFLDRYHENHLKGYYSFCQAVTGKREKIPEMC